MSSKRSAALVTLIKKCAAELSEAAASLCVLSCRGQGVPAEQHVCRRCFCCAAGESENPQGVVNTSEGRVVRAFHRFTLVDQSGGGRDLTKGRRRDQVGASH